tara:strand:+ start:40783 stop:41454 length:672 start_codon:yes stop_codon:yes gene_type:complete
MNMTDYTSARKNMVECQLHPCGISEQRVLDAYSNIPREKFVSEAQRSIAYADNDLPLGHERFLMAPMTHAKLVHAANVGAEDVVLDIGGATGYSAAILSQLATTVVAVENQPDFVEHAKAALIDLDLLNILHLDTPLQNGDKKHAPYDVIILNGAANHIPNALLLQLNVGGRLCYIHRQSTDDVCGNAVMLTKRADGQCDKKTLFETRGHFLTGLVMDAPFAF